MANLIKRILADASPFDATKRIVRPDGEVRYIRCVGAPVFENRKLKKYIGSALDVTEHELLTQELQRREAYLAEAQRLSHTGSFGWNLATGELVWSDENFLILGYEPTVKPTLDLIMQRVHPDDRSLVEETIEKVNKGASLDYEHRLLMPDGSVKHVHVIGRRLAIDSTNEVELVGTVMDVTTTKKAFEEIKALRDELQRENIVLREELGKTSMFEEVIGTSPVLQMVLARAAKVAPTDSTVLIMGETGTGKELIARAIHKRSKRSEHPFISVNCAAVPSSLIMSELFGHEKGAFTGAVQRRLGRFELAEGGTIFLDEVGDLPMETQIALLRVLQEREFERVGGTEVLRADVRVISATNRDLQAAIADGAFRSDLYYRLNVFPIKLPPLRERKEDVPLLVNYFVDRYAKRAGKKIKHIQKKALEALQNYSWPGNVRELQNVIERSLIIGETTEFSIDKSWVANEPQQPGSAAIDQKTNERQRIEAALAQSIGKISGAHGAAAKLGMPASTLESKIRALKINKFQFKGV
jgi:transcriptional regulator with GAF, ATPase, and Fis domain